MLKAMREVLLEADAASGEERGGPPLLPETPEPAKARVNRDSFLQRRRAPADTPGESLFCRYWGFPKTAWTAIAEGSLRLQIEGVDR